MEYLKLQQVVETLHSGQNDYEIDALSTGPFAPPFARSLAPLTHLLAPHCSRRSRAPLRLFVHSLTRSFRSSWERSFCLLIERVDFIQIQPTVDPRLTGRLVFFPPPSPTVRLTVGPFILNKMN